MRLNSLAQVGGANSIENFARSWQRAAGFAEIPPRQPSFIFADEEEESGGARISDEGSPGEHRSLLRQRLDSDGAPESVFEDNASSEQVEDDSSDWEGSNKPAKARGRPITGHAPYLASPFASKYDGVYGSLSSRVNASSLRHADRLFHEQQVGGIQDPDKAHEPLLIKRVEREDGKLVQVVVGQSTLPQTVFNSVNVLIGVGLLSLPLGFRYSGWIVGVIFFFFSALATRYTAGILAKCLDVDQSLITFADIAFTAFGTKARVLTSVIFFFELIAACVALLVLFADSLDALIPGWGIVEFKILGGIILVPLSFVPLRFLSFTSVLGIVSCLGSRDRHISASENVLMICSRHLGFCGRLFKSTFAWIVEGTCRDVSIPESMVHITSELRSFDVYVFSFSITTYLLINKSSMGWPQRISEHLQRHATSEKVFKRIEHYIWLLGK